MTQEWSQRMPNFSSSYAHNACYVQEYLWYMQEKENIKHCSIWSKILPKIGNAFESAVEAHKGTALYHLVVGHLAYTVRDDGD